MKTYECMGGPRDGERLILEDWESQLTVVTNPDRQAPTGVYRLETHLAPGPIPGTTRRVLVWQGEV